MNSIPKDIKAGTYFSAKIEGIQLSGRIQKEAGTYYLCQNLKDGRSCSNRCKFPYSWSVSDGSDLEEFEVTDFKILSEKPIDLKPEKPIIVGMYNVIFQPKFVVVFTEKITHAMVRAIGKYQKLSLEAKYRLKMPKNKIGDWAVCYDDDYIKVGCNKVTNDELNVVIAYLDKNYPVRKK